MNLMSRNLPAVLAAACITVACATAFAAGPAALGTGLTVGYHLSKSTSLPLRPIDLTPFQGKFSTEILASPATGLQAEIVMYTRLAPGAPKRGLYTMPADHTFLVMKGKVNIQIGTDSYVVEKDGLALIHPDTPVQIWNAGTEQVDILETISPTASSDLAYLITPATATKVENAAQYIFMAPALETKGMKGGVGHEGLNERVLASTDNDSTHILERLDDVLPGGGGPPTHAHEEDQLYLVTAGTMTVEYKGAKMPAVTNTLVILPRGVRHANTNTGDVTESHITLLMPAQPGGGPRGIQPIRLSDHQPVASKPRPEGVGGTVAPGAAGPGGGGQRGQGGRGAQPAPVQ